MKRSSEPEMIDFPGHPRELLEDDLKNLRRLNRYVGGYRSVERGLERLVQQRKLACLSLLDVGTGSADIPARIVRWVKANRIRVKIIALEFEPITAAIAARRTRHLAEISIVRGDAAAPPFPSASFDCVLASQFLHHFPDEKIISLLRTWSQLARRTIIVSDLVRHPVAYYGAQVLTRLFTTNVMTRTDAPWSVRRALTLVEWRALFSRAAIGEFDIAAIFPFRMVGRFVLAGGR